MQPFVIPESSLTAAPRDEDGLTPRELEVLTHIAEGREAKEVARLLCCSKRTVDFHLKNIFEKFNVNNRLKAINIAYEKGLLS